MRRLLAFAVLSLLPACSKWFFSGEHWMDRSRPVVLVETTGGVELGATPEYGILTLGRTAKEGAYRVHYFLGPTPMVDDGQLTATDSIFTRAEIDLRTQMIRILDRELRPSDELFVMWTPNGTTTQTVDVELARLDGIEGDVLMHPGQDLPTGATLLRRNEMESGFAFVGLIAGSATVEGGPAQGRYFVFAGINRMRELLAVPEKYPVDYELKHRADGITVLKPIK